MNELGSYLKELRGKKSLRDVQKDTGISHTYLSTLEKGIDPRTNKPREPSFDTLKKLSDYYDVSYIDLLSKAGYVTIDEVFDDVDSNNPLTKKKVVNGVTFTGFYGLEEVLQMDIDIYYKNELLTKEEKQKILTMLETILE